MVRQQYGNDFMQSLTALRKAKGEEAKTDKEIDPALLRNDISEAERNTREQFRQLHDTFVRHENNSQLLKSGGLWPSVTPIALLETLRSSSSTVFGENIREALIAYGLSITTLQRLVRLEDALHRPNQEQKLADERANYGHSNWLPAKRPDWLLLEIDANILIRPGQVDVTDATVSPASGSNSVLQMNMGQGKTSCVIPMAAAVLADGKNLLRVVVPKPLLLQTAQLLHARLGGLVGRELRHVPFSRKTSTDAVTINVFESIHREMQASSGVMIVLPEHMLVG
jgi:primosomal protein N'